MKQYTAWLLGTYLFACMGPLEGWAGKHPSEPEQNLRVVLTVEKTGEEPTTYTIVTLGAKGTMDSLAGMIEIDGRQMPVIQRFDADVRLAGEDEYLVKIIFGKSFPTLTSVTKQKEGDSRFTFQYLDVGAESLLRMKLGDEIQFAKDSDQALSVRLEAADK